MTDPKPTSDDQSNSNQTRSHQPDATDANFDELTRHLEAFLQEWETNGFGPMLTDHLPKADTPLRRMVLIELIKVDLEYRHNSDGPVLKLEDYAAEHREFRGADGVPAELIYEEYHIRRTAGETVSIEDLLTRFPDQKDDIHRVFQIDATDTVSTSGQQLAEAFETGEQVDDFYLMSALGAGAFGSVFLARQVSMQRMVALKISSDKGTEGQTLAQLDHPNIVRVYDQHRLPHQNLRLLYMQFAAGGTLQAVVKSSKDVPDKSGRIVMQCIAEALDHTGVISSDNVAMTGGLADKSWAAVTCQLGNELAQALHYAHCQGILHRDVKPANVLLDANGRAKLADFNISFSSEVEDANAADNFGGSLAYMSPEQLDACNPGSQVQPTDLDARSDVFSLGVLLWELMFGSRPFDDESISGGWTETVSGMAALRREGVSHAPVKPQTAVEHRLFAILQKCLAPAPKHRYQTANELAQDFSLSLQSRVARLMHNSLSGWKHKAILWPTIAFLIAAISPHVLGAVFNLFYNDEAIIAELNRQNADEAATSALKDKFLSVVITINSIAFPIGLACCVWYFLPVAQALKRRVDSGMSVEPARLRALSLGRFVTILGITEWVIAGVAYPVVMHSIIGELDAQWYLHFFASLVICGLLAAAYPFFLTATLCIRSLVPALMRSSPFTSDDATELQRLSDQSVWSLYLAGGVPAVGIMILLTTQEAYDPHLSLTLKILSLLGAVGFGFALSLSKTLQTDIEGLLDVYRMQAD